MIRVLHVLGGLGTGGTESLIMNWYRNIDRSKIQFDFLVRSNDTNYAEEILALGGRIFYTSSFPRHFLKNRRETEAVLKRREWAVIHVHGNAAMYMLPLKLAKKYGYDCRIMHSHSVKAKNVLFSLVHHINRAQLAEAATHHLACSTAAGEWMFGNTPFVLSRNAIAPQSMQYSSSARTALRETLEIGEKLVIGHAGRFVDAKNHEFLLNLFAALNHKNPNSILLLVGDGELEQAMRRKATQLGTADSVIFAGRQANVGEWMSAMDVFVLPSLYEGLGIVLVEAQCSGLPCVVSQEAYNEEVSVYPDRLSVLPLSCGAEEWADCVLQKASIPVNRDVDLRILQNCGYDMESEIKKLEALYLASGKA